MQFLQPTRLTQAMMEVRKKMEEERKSSPAEKYQEMIGKELDRRNSFLDSDSLHNPSLFEFVSESNRIEGILRTPKDYEIFAHERLLALETVTVDDLRSFVWTIQTGAKLRSEVGMNVRVGIYCPPPGGPQIERDLEDLLRQINADKPLDPYEAHLRYEALHPFTDGNGRSGRALWLWQTKDFSLPFLHLFYYSTLSRSK